jgi:hypothetical protein
MAFSNAVSLSEPNHQPLSRTNLSNGRRAQVRSRRTPPTERFRLGGSVVLCQLAGVNEEGHPGVKRGQLVLNVSTASETVPIGQFRTQLPGNHLLLKPRLQGASLLPEACHPSPSRRPELRSRLETTAPFQLQHELARTGQRGSKGSEPGPHRGLPQASKTTLYNPRARNPGQAG